MLMKWMKESISPDIAQHLPWNSDCVQWTRKKGFFFNLPYCNKDLMTSIKNTRFQDDKQC